MPKVDVPEAIHEEIVDLIEVFTKGQGELHRRIDELEAGYADNQVWRDMAHAISVARTGERVAKRAAEAAAVEIASLKSQLAEWDAFRQCPCGQAWKPVAGLFGTTEEVTCPACVLRRMRAREEESAHA